jgi:hypothetical protein
MIGVSLPPDCKQIFLFGLPRFMAVTGAGPLSLSILPFAIAGRFRSRKDSLSSFRSDAPGA